ncbi:hypothetical protein BYT27DRAFT_7183855 [Phlegmacium glaucopus]|nr:hypothetical protein BYT27DRAFT_7183855 [Phlegmacium glaucopus]
MAVYAEDIKKAANLMGSDLVIAFMGPTGSGKSNLIDTLTGQPGRRAGSYLESCTTEVHAVRLFNHKIYGDRLVFVDTPGFDDTNKSDLEILEMISKWLQKVYEKQIKLAGIVYLHRITDNRMAGSPHRNLRMFGELCGDQAVKKVVLVTTMWDKAYSSAPGKQKDQDRETEKLIHREKDLFEHYWKTMIDHGASTARFTNSPQSAWGIIDILLRQQEAEVLLLQEEIVDLKRALNETQAGKTLYSDLQKLLAEQRDTVRSLAQQARVESNPQLARQLETELKRIQKDFDKTFNEMKNLKIPIGKRIMLMLFGKKSRARSLHF